MPILSGIAGFFDKYVLGYALGTAAGPSLEPFVQDLANTAWGLNQVKPPDAVILALGVAQGQVDEQAARTWASHTGFGKDQFDALISIANVGPALGLAYEAWRRGQLTDVEFTTALNRQGIETQWYPALRSLKDRPLEPAEIAKAIHRGIMKNDGLLIATPPTTPGKVEYVPESKLDPVTEASWSGLSEERLRILTGNAGLPPGIVQMLQLLNRGEITDDDFLRGVGESNLRNEWGPAMLKLRRHLLTPHEYEEAALRGIIKQADADTGAALSGMHPADAQLLFEIMGRPLAVHQITTGLARGGTYGGTYADIPQPYRDAVRRSNIRPEYARLAYANRYTIPSYFILRAILQDGGMTEAEFADYGKQLGWPPDLADKAAVALSGGTTATVDPNVKKAHTKAWTEAQSSYIAQESTAADVQPIFDLLGVDATAAQEIVSTWNAIRALVRKQLTPTQIRKALGEGVINPATGSAWTMADAMAALLARGYDQADATVFLNE